jgi:hypothetical protein
MFRKVSLIHRKTEKMNQQQEHHRLQNINLLSRVFTFVLPQEVNSIEHLGEFTRIAHVHPCWRETVFVYNCPEEIDLLRCSDSQCQLVLSNFAALQVLHLTDTKITDAAIPEIAKLSSLQKLYLGQTKISDASMPYVAQLTSLQALYLHSTNITDAALPHISQLTSLRKLSLSNTKVTDAGIVHIANLTSLQSLWLIRTQITDAVMPIIAKLIALEVLHLRSTQVSDTGLMLLVNLPHLSLDTLSTDGTKVSREGLEAFEKQLLENQEKNN